MCLAFRFSLFFKRRRRDTSFDCDWSSDVCSSDLPAYFDTNRSLSYRRDWACGTRTYNQHDGVDLGIGGFPAMDSGRWVMSAAAGTVVAAHDGEFDRCRTGNCGTGNYVKIRHADGKISVYWHLKKWSVRVRVGQWVPCGVHRAGG